HDPRGEQVPAPPAPPGTVARAPRARVRERRGRTDQDTDPGTLQVQTVAPVLLGTGRDRTEIPRRHRAAPRQDGRRQQQERSTHHPTHATRLAPTDTASARSHVPGRSSRTATAEAEPADRS